MNLRQLPNAIVKSVVEFRANLKDNMEKANAGFPVVITSNDEVKSVLVSPEQAQYLFGDNAPSVDFATDAIDDTPLAPLPTHYDDKTKEEVILNDLPPKTTAAAIGVPPILSEPSPVDVQPSVAEASAEEAQVSPADASDEEDLGQCPACIGEGEDHVVPSNQHRTEADIPDDAEIVSEDETETRSEEEAPEPTEVEADQTPIECEVNVVSSNVHCLRDAVKAIRFNNAEFSICDYHLKQLEEKNLPYDIISETPVVSG